MKSFITKLTALVFVLAIVASACPLSFAESVINVGDIQYVVDGKKATVYKYVGSGGKVTVKSKVNGATVTEIGNYAFAEEYDSTDPSKRITSVSIPGTVKKIGKGAFMECTALESVELPISLTTLGDTVFWYCESLKKVVAFPELKIIGEKVFHGCPDDLTIYCEKGTVVEKYAKSYGIKTQSYTPTSLKLSKTSLSLNKGETYTVNATVKPTSAYLNTVSWSSDNKSVASVNQSGKITANKYGKTTVTCQTLFGDLKKTVSVNVRVPQIKQLKCTNKTYTGYTLTWEKISGADGYTLQEYVNGEWKTLKNTALTKYNAAKLSQGSSHKYRVRAYANQDSQKFRGAWSETLTASTKAVGTVRNLAVSDCSSTSIKLSWSKVSGANGYEIYLYNTSSKKYERVYTTAKTSFTHEKLSASGKYTYKVRAYIKSGDTKIRGNSSSALSAYTAPSKVKNVRSGGATKSTLTVKWSSVKNASGYQLYVTGNDYKKTVTTTSSSYKLTGLEKKAKYTVKVRAYVENSGKKYYGSYSSAAALYTNYVPSSVSDIVEEFNDALSNTAKAGELYSIKTENTTAKMTEKDFSDRSTTNTVKALIDEFTGMRISEKSITYDKNGKVNKDAAEFLTGSDSISAIPSSAVKKASYVKDGSGYFVTLELKPESVKNDKLPKNSSKLAPMVDWGKVSAFCSPDAEIASVSTKYTGTTVKGKINKSGRFDTLFISAPFTSQIEGTVNGEDHSITVEGKKSFDFVITWW